MVTRKAKHGKQINQRSRSTPAGTGTSVSSTATPERVGSSSIANEPNNPAMLTSLAAVTSPAAANPASIRTSPASCDPRSSNEGKNGKSDRIVPSRQTMSPSRWPAATLAADNAGPGQWPTAKADRATRSALLVRWPPTTGTSYNSDANRIPSSAARHSSGVPTRVLTIAPGIAPIAATSLTLVSTAAIPAPYGSASTNAGRIASPQATTCWPSITTTAPSSPGPWRQSPGPKTSRTTEMSAFDVQPGDARMTPTRCSTVAPGS